MADISEILSAFQQVKRTGDQWMAQCPGHDDQRASLSISQGRDGRVLLNCHAGCTIEAILAPTLLEMPDLFPKRQVDRQRIVATYDYLDEQRELLFQVVRFDPKKFRPRRPDGHGGWNWNLVGTPHVLYRLPDLRGQKTVFATEGEKDADGLWSLGLPATTNAGGAGKWRPEYVEQLKRAGCQHVVVLPDNDPAGETHGRDVARSCVDAGFDVKVIPLPGLPRKGDVSDYLTQHSKDELRAIVKDAPLFRPSQLVAAPIPMTLTTLADLLAEPEGQVEYLVEDRIPAGATVLMVGAPKTGKSHTSREVGFAVSRGEPWLGWRTTFGAVWLLIFEDKRSEVRKHFRALGATGCEPIRLFIDQAPADLLPRLHELTEKERPALIIVDTLARALKVKDFNDYAEITQRFEPLLKLSRDTGATLLLLHHASAHANREGLDAVLGSTALSGSVDNILILKRTNDQRILSSVQRIGPDMEPTIITLNATTGRLERAGTKRQVDDVALATRILEVLREQPEPVTESYLRQQVEGRLTDQARVLRHLLGRGQVRRTGAGAKGNPYRYEPENTRSHNSADQPLPEHHRERELSGANKGDSLDFDILVPVFPISTSGNEHFPSPRTYENHTTSQDSRSLVPDLSETTTTNAPEHHEPSINSGLNSRSRIHENRGGYERF